MKTIDASLIRTKLLSIAAFAALGGLLAAQTTIVDPASTNLPNPNPTVINGWGPLPDGRTWGSSAGVDIDPDGHVWAYDRCGAVALSGGCDTNPVNPILKLDRTTGKVLASLAPAYSCSRTVSMSIAMATCGSPILQATKLEPRVIR